MEEDKDTCFECLERRILDEFSSDLVFRYGVSDSALPFGSAAVVQVNLNGGKTEQSTSDDVKVQLVMVKFAYHDDCCPNINLNICLEKSSEDARTSVEDGLPSQEYTQYQLEDFSENHDESIASSHSLQKKYSSLNICEDPEQTMVPEDSVRRMIAALAPAAHFGSSCYSDIESIAYKFISGAIEDHVASSLKILVEGKPPGRHAADFLNLVGLPAFGETNIPRSVRHPNIVPLLGVLKSDNHVNLLYPKAPYTLENILHFSPNALKSDWHIRFLVYQIVSALAYLHSLGIAHGNLCPSNVMLTDSCWSWLNVYDKHLLRHRLNFEGAAVTSPRPCCTENCRCQSLYADLKLSTPIDWHSDFKRWWAGELSNYDYLLVLNRLAGRRWGDYTFHTVMPWVIDFSVKPDDNSDSGWRDLQKSKWRLAKGDEQLDFTYLTSEIPHHVSDECLSELAVCSYKARRLPLNVLRYAVRSVYEPNEYPSNMQRLYQWTPDECIPEFYSDPQIFNSLHSGMSDLAVPSWASSPEEFISLHRAALESDHVSQQIHHWIDITFGYKLSGQASIAAKNVMLPSSDPTIPKSMGRRQLFTRPHPKRQVSGRCSKETYVSFPMHETDTRNSYVMSDISNSSHPKSLLPKISNLEELEEAVSFCEHAWNLSPIYKDNLSAVRPLRKRPSDNDPQNEIFVTSPGNSIASEISLRLLIEHLVVDDNGSLGYQELLRWKRNISSNTYAEELAKDMFSVGCLLAELYLKRPLFSPVSLAAYAETGDVPGTMLKLPPPVVQVVEACIQRDWKRRPSAKCFLESQYFPSSVRSAYVFLCPLQLLADTGKLLQYAASLATEGAFKAVGPFALEMCVPYCIPVIMRNLSDVESESAVCLLKEFLKYLKSEAIKTLILPAIQKILQAPEYSHLKVSLLQESFVREVWKRLGKQVYLEKLHPLVISNLYNSPKKISSSAASVLLICCSDELGIPITLNSTILPLICCLGKGLCGDGIDALVRIGSLLGEKFIVRQLLPLLRNVILSCIHVSSMNKPEPLQSWNSLALIDSLTVLEGLIMILPKDVVLKELILDQSCLHVKILMHSRLDLLVIQVAATQLVAVCQQIGPDFTALHVLPQLKDLFDELAFSQEAAEKTRSYKKSLKTSASNLDEETCIGSRMDLVSVLYPSFASLIGIEKLRQCCAAWLVLEQYLQRFHNWKWEFVGQTSRSEFENTGSQRLMFDMHSSSDYAPAKLLLNGVGWSIPQSQGPRGNKNVRTKSDFQRTAATKEQVISTVINHEPWFWFPSPATSLDGLDFVGRIGSLKDDLPWKIKASILYSARAHPGALRSLAVCHDESTVFTGGVGPGFKGTVQKWDLPRMNCLSGYYGHEEVVNDICILSVSGRIASCDGTIHIWNSLTGKLIASHAESSVNLSRVAHTTPSISRVCTDQTTSLTSTVLSEGILSSAFSGNSYTCMNYLESDDILVVGTGNGSVRFIDVAQDRKLHLWKSDAVDFSLSSLVSAIWCCGSRIYPAETVGFHSSLIAVGLSSGHCRLLDKRSGDIVAFWRAHDSYITKLAAPEDHLLVSSSLDKTLRVWDIRRSMSSQSNVFKGHSDGISSFAVWGKDVISVSRSNIGLSSLSRNPEEGGQRQISPQKLYLADRGTRNLSVLSTICVLPFSRLFLVGTEDGYLKICC